MAGDNAVGMNSVGVAARFDQRRALAMDSRLHRRVAERVAEGGSPVTVRIWRILRHRMSATDGKRRFRLRTSTG